MATTPSADDKDGGICSDGSMTAVAATALRPDVSVERIVGVSADRLYDLVSDLPRMGEWSPENEGGRWRGRATGPAVGARFRGRNRNGRRRWTTTCTVTEARRGQAFGFDVRWGPFAVSSWHFELSAVAGERRLTNVVQRYTDRRGRVMRAIGRLTTGVSDRTEHNFKTMTQTLLALSAIAESDDELAAPSPAASG
jgi:Polyketide cyclase / dehydrase and lipid transport